MTIVAFVCADLASAPVTVTSWSMAPSVHCSIRCHLMKNEELTVGGTGSSSEYGARGATSAGSSISQDPPLSTRSLPKGLISSTPKARVSTLLIGWSRDPAMQVPCTTAMASSISSYTPSSHSWEAAMGRAGQLVGHVVILCQVERSLVTLDDGCENSRRTKFRGSSGIARLLDTKERDVSRAASSVRPLASAASSQWPGISW